jgi:hypothetical protein
MQCASSTAISGQSSSRSSERKPAEPSRSGAAEPSRSGAASDASHALAHLPCLERRSQKGRRDAAGTKRAHLVLHQGDEWRDHQRGSRQERRRELVDQALAAPRRRHQQEPAGGKQRLDRLALAGAKAVVAEPAKAFLQAGAHAGLALTFGAPPSRVVLHRTAGRHGDAQVRDTR